MNIGDKKVNWLSYFSLNNIELDILLNTIDIVLNEGRVCKISDYVEKTVFEKLNPNLVEKLRSKGILKSFTKHGETFYTVTTRGLKAFFEVISPVNRIITKYPGLDSKTLAHRVSKYIIYGGVHKVYSIHERIVDKILKIMSNAGFIVEKESRYYPAELNDRVKASIKFIEKISSHSFLRNIGDIAQSITRSLRLPREKVNDIISGALYSSLLVSEKDPRKTIIDLLPSLKTRIDHSIKEGKLLEASAYSSLTLHLMKALSKDLGSIKNLENTYNLMQIKLYELLGDYFYHNLSFDTAMIFYGKAAAFASDKPEFVKNIHRIKAKYMLSKARSLATRKRFEDAISELDGLIEYYKSIGLMREADIALALRREYQGEVEVLRGKSCIAHGLFEEAAAIYNRLGSRYNGKALAAHCKALISRGECELLVNKNHEAAISILDEAAKLADQILSPHLRNAALSLYYEAHARISVEKGDLLGASNDFREAAKYYSSRGLIKRSLLSSARAHKFMGFHHVFNDEYNRAYNNFVESYHIYTSLLNRLYRHLTLKPRINFYLLGEALKGVLDTKAFIELIDALKIIEESIILAPSIIDKLIDKAMNTGHYLIEASREIEYKLVSDLISTLYTLKERSGVKDLEHKIILIEQELKTIQEVYIGSGKEPRKESIARILVAILTRIKYGLETITHYLEEI